MEVTENRSESEEQGLEARLNAVADHFRDNPMAIYESPQHIADDLKVPLALIQNIQEGLRGPVDKESSLERLLRISKTVFLRLRTLFESGLGVVLKFLRSLTDRPIQLLTVTSLALFGIVILQGMLSDSTSRLAQLVNSVSVAIILLTLAAHVVCFFRHGKARYPIIAGLVFTVSMLLLGSIESSDMESNPIALTVAAILFGFIYGAMGTVVSVVGGFVAVRREERRDKKLSRQELVGRLLEVQQALKGLNRDSLMRQENGSLLERTRGLKLFPLIAMAFGVFAGIFEVAVMGTYSRLTGGFDWNNAVAASRPGAMIVLVTTFFVGLVIMAMVGYLGGRIVRSLVSVFMVYLGMNLAYLVPVHPYGWDYVVANWQEQRFLNGLTFMLVIGVVSGFAATVDSNQFRKQRLRGRDAAQLISEMVLLQWRLNIGSRMACVMSVDVAGSTRLKSNNDHLRVEFSFREYQSLVEEVSQRHGGYVFSTAGDGAIVAFPGSQVALEAAREIHSEMRDFNRKRNRLDQKFRIRIGLHSGETSADFGDAPFNELIDIAAHIEKVAPVGGIAVSQATAKDLGDTELVELANAIDGQTVFYVQDSIGEA